MEEVGEMVQIRDAAGLEKHLALWNFTEATERLPVGYVLSLEGADSILTPAHLERAYAYGLRAVGPAHYGPGRYSMGTNAEGGLTPQGRDLLKQMRALGMILDATHLTDAAFWEALELFDGPVWASHNNCRALVPHGRQFSDGQLKALVDRDAVVGVAFDAWMLVPDWVRGSSTPQNRGVTLAQVADNVDHICQVAGNARHAGIGSDLDGAFGTEQGPADVDTIADLQKLPALLEARGYTAGDIENVCSGNFLRVLRQAWSR
jgi:membrane dipeptidase